MLKLGIGLLLLGLILFPSNSFGQICFDDSTASRMVVELERAKIMEQQLLTQSSGNVELQNQIDILKTTINLYQEQITVYKNMQEMNQKMSDMKDKACTEQIKAATPTFTENMQKYLTGVGIGGILAGIAILLL